MIQHREFSETLHQLDFEEKVIKKVRHILLEQIGVPFPQRFAIAPATIRRVWGSSASSAVMARRQIPPWVIMSSWFDSEQAKLLSDTVIMILKNGTQL